MEYDELLDKYKALLAEYANYRKRTTKEKEELKENGGKNMLLTILPAIDDLERAIKNATQDKDAFIKGVCLSYMKLIKSLQDNGVQIMDAIGHKFNPEFHNAIGVCNGDDNDTIQDCIKHGYILNGKVIRHAQVIVSQKQN